MKVTDKKFAKSPTQETLAYIMTLYNYKKSHIAREQARLEHLEYLLHELTAITK
jgi:hypothetical protein